MKMRLALVALLVLAAAAVVVIRSPRHSSRPVARRVSAAAPESVATPIAIPADSGLTFQVLRDRALAPYRLRPDRRWILAVTETRRLAGVPDSALTIQFASGRWTVRCGSQPVGSLSDLPDFPEMLDVLTDWARTQAWSHGWSDNTGPERADLARALERMDAPSALREADRAWANGARDAALFRDAARAYAMLSLETPGWDGRSDLIAARGMAMLAYARALGSDDPRRESCLLATAMGYPAAARQWARSLAATDPLRLYVNGDDTALERSAGIGAGSERAHPPVAALAKSAVSTKSRAKSGTGTHAHAATRTVAASSPKKAPTKTAATTNTPPASGALEAGYLDLLRLAGRDDFSSWSTLVDRLAHSGTPQELLLASGFAIRNSEARARVAERVLQAMAPHAASARKATARAAAPQPATSFAARIQRVEVMLEAGSASKGGVLFGAELAREQRRSLAYAALDAIGDHALASGSAAEITRAFAIGSTKHTPRRVATVQRWYAHLANARVGRPDLTALRADVDSSAPGPAQALRSYEALRAQAAADDAALRDAARDLARRMDSRPDQPKPRRCSAMARRD